MRNLIGIVALSLLAAVAGCNSDDGQTKQTTSTTSSDPNNPFAEIEQSVIRFASANCTGTAVLTVQMVAAQPILITKRVVDSAITVNGTNCGASSVVKRIVVTGTAGDDTVIVDYTNGLFATGAAASSTAIAIDLDAGSNTVGIKGTSGADTVALGTTGSTKWANMAVDIYPDLNIDVTDGTPETIVYLGDGADIYSGGTFGAAVHVYGGAGNDVFNQTATSTPYETIEGGLGTDTLSYASRPNVITVGIGAGTSTDGESGEQDQILTDIESLIGGLGNDILTAYSGGSTIDGGAGNDSLVGLAGADSLTGGAGNDTFDGGAGNDTLNGDAGADSLTGGLGADSLNGGADDDVFYEGAATSTGGDIFNGGTGTDLVDYSGRTTNAVTVTMDGATALDGETGELDNVKADVENIKGSGLADTITGNALNNLITGGLGADTLDGGAGDDIFAEYSGCVTSTDALGNWYCSGAGTEASTPNGNDKINGGAGVDAVDYLRLSPLVVVMNGTTPSGWTAGSEADLIGTDVEDIYGGAGADNITGNSSTNLLLGGLGDDTLTGLAGDDELDGGGGSSTVDGGAGFDMCYGAATTTPTDCEN